MNVISKINKPLKNRKYDLRFVNKVDLVFLTLHSDDK